MSSLTFVGNATTVLRLGGFTVLTDPNFLHRGQRAYLGYGLSSKRLVDPAFPPSSLPKLDAVLLSHMHGDHFDRVARRELDRGLPVFTTGHAARRLDRWGFSAAEGLKPWETREIERGGERLRVTSVPGAHGPKLASALMPPVMGSVVELERDGRTVLRLYITGDTLCRPWLAEVAERFPGLDAMVIHLGGTRVLGMLLTMDGKQGADLVQLVRPGLTVPVHYEEYGVMKSPLQDFVDEAVVRELPGTLRPIERGKSIEFTHRP
ncbi:MBL fold metallo-hydrolase [Allokutzneria albata]|uniref:L-ascorbate metabolism protein UlaG, beta-lactamase superfamily n=1 Tax=Allokutzneria albata TaxID=211114 RepID=A0A1G9V662_ALLAB|nr:MBL fold metallo-hydrolase [Allokutzneria albata]SDM67682.1 L-ascorbate metabolism protein UlaG, beta-lactamase superfamily [Allokutzneria albata]